MTNNTENLKENLTGFAFGILENLPGRPGEIVAKRFGLKNGREKTLEEIGRDYKISRERVRQIEKAALKKLKELKNDESAAGVFDRLREIIKRRGGVIGERNLIRIVLGEEGRAKSRDCRAPFRPDCYQDSTSLAMTAKSCPARGALFLALELDNEMEKTREDNYFMKRWICSPPPTLPERGIEKVLSRERMGRVNNKHGEESLERQVEFVNYLINFFNSAKKIISPEEMAGIFREKIIKDKKMIAEEEKEVLLSYLEPSKLIEQNYFGQWGLKSWPEIKPRSIKDKIYLALKKEKRPLHFVEIAEAINKICQDKRLAKPQTVHNELIKDERCVLIGRGIYALKEWGYQSGIVKEVIAKILKGKGGTMNRDEIIKEVLGQRQVKKNTVIVNLKNHDCFVRLDAGKYGLKS